MFRKSTEKYCKQSRCGDSLMTLKRNIPIYVRCLSFQLTSRKGQMMGTNQFSVFTGSGLCQHVHMATVMEAKNLKT